MPVPIVPPSTLIPHLSGAAQLAPQPASSSGAFQSAFTDAVSRVEAFQSHAQSSIDRFLSGEGEELHNVAIRAQEADLSFQLFLQVRNKVLAAYQQVMQMQV